MGCRLLFMMLVLLMANESHAQIRSTKEAKVILVVNTESRSVTQMILFAKVQQMTNEELLNQYPDSKFYIGLLSGTYELMDNGITPGKNATIIMYTDRQFFPTEYFSSEHQHSPGDEFNIGGTKTKVVSSKKGELTLKT